MKQLPSPGVLLAEMVPPIISTSFFEMESPRPVPPWVLVVDFSAWLNELNNFGSLSDGIPMPESQTENSSCTILSVFSNCFTDNTMLPVSVNFTAFPSRLIRIWRKRVGSPIKLSGVSGGQ